MREEGRLLLLETLLEEAVDDAGALRAERGDGVRRRLGARGGRGKLDGRDEWRREMIYDS